MRYLLTEEFEVYLHLEWANIWGKDNDLNYWNIMIRE